MREQGISGFRLEFVLQPFHVRLDANTGQVWTDWGAGIGWYGYPDSDHTALQHLTVFKGAVSDVWEAYDLERLAHLRAEDATSDAEIRDLSDLRAFEGGDCSDL